MTMSPKSRSNFGTLVSRRPFEKAVRKPILTAFSFAVSRFYLRTDRNYCFIEKFPRFDILDFPEKFLKNNSDFISEIFPDYFSGNNPEIPSGFSSI